MQMTDDHQWHREVAGLSKGKEIIKQALYPVPVFIIPSLTYYHVLSRRNSFGAHIAPQGYYLAIFEPIQIDWSVEIPKGVKATDYKKKHIPGMIYSMEFSELLGDEIWQMIAKDMLYKWDMNVKQNGG